MPPQLTIAIPIYKRAADLVSCAAHTSDMTIELASGTITHHSRQAEPWRVTLVDTGANSQPVAVCRVSRIMSARKASA